MMMMRTPSSGLGCFAGLARVQGVQCCIIVSGGSTGACRVQLVATLQAATAWARHKRFAAECFSSVLPSAAAERLCMFFTSSCMVS